MMRWRASYECTVPGCALLLCAAALWYFHDRFWWPPDDGVYAYVAQRINAGDVLHRDLIDFHAGYVNFLHAFAFRIFGEDLLSLRYPLACLTLIQAILAAQLMRPRGPWIAAAATLVVTATSFIQFLNPSANWYALFFMILTCWSLSRIRAARMSGLVFVGFLLGLCFLFRQLSGVFLAMGTLTWLLLVIESPRPGRAWVARGLLAIMAIGLAGYLWSKGSLSGFLLVGIWPLAILMAIWGRVCSDDRAVLGALLRLALGAALAAAPLVIYHALHGSLAAWMSDSLFTALLIHGQDFIARANLLQLFLGGILGLTEWRQPGVVLNGGLWIALVAAPALLGVVTLRALIRNDTRLLVQPLPIMASFFAPVALHYQIPIYLWFAIAPVLLSLLWMGSAERPRWTAASLLLLAGVAVIYQAGQPLSRGFPGIVRGERIALDAASGLPRASLRIERSDQELYRAIIARIDAEAESGEPLFTLPMDPELNFLTGRRTPVRYFGTPLALRTATDVIDSLRAIDAAAPLFVVHRRQDKYLTPLSQDLLQEIRRRASTRETFGPFDLYRLPARTASQTSPTARE